MRERILRMRRLLAFAGMDLLFACAPGASPLPLLPASTPRPICEGGHYPPTARFCLSLEGDPRPGHPFTLTLDAFYYAYPGEPSYTLTIILPDSLEISRVETSRPYRIQSNRLVSLIDPAELADTRKIEGGTFTGPGTILTVDLGREGQQKLWDPKAEEEEMGERVRVTVRLREPGEWQIRGILGQGESIPRASITLLGWSTESQAYWTDYDTAFMRAFRLETRQCGGSNSGCTIRFPYDPYRFALGVPPDVPGRALRERPTTFCENYGQPGTCAEYGIDELEPWQRGLEPPPPGFCEEGMNRLSAICEEWLRERPEEQAPTPSPDARALPLLPARPTRPLPTRPIPRLTPTPGTPIPPGPTPTSTPLPRPTATPPPPGVSQDCREGSIGPANLFPCPPPLAFAPHPGAP